MNSQSHLLKYRERFYIQKEKVAKRNYYKNKSTGMTRHPVRLDFRIN